MNYQEKFTTLDIIILCWEGDSMVVMIQNKNIVNANIRNVFFYLDKNFRNYDWDQVEEDIRMGFTSLQNELFNATKALLILKEQYKNNQKVCCAINNYLKALAKENNNIKIS